MINVTKYAVAAALAILPNLSQAGVVTLVVDAKANSSNTMNGLATGVILEQGETFKIQADDDDTWFLGGSTTEYANADGLTNYPMYTQNNMEALYGTLAGRIDKGEFFSVGTHFEGQAANSGELFLFNWDAGNSENLDTITVTITTADKAVSAVPLPATGTLMIASLVAVGFMRRRA